MRNSFSNGSMWISLARFSTACAIMAFTRRMTGASLAMSRRCSRSSVASPAVAPSRFRCLLGLAVIAVDGVEDFLLAGEPGSTASPVHAAHRRMRFEVQRIGHRQRERVIVQRHGQAAELAQKLARAFRSRRKPRAALRW